MSKGIKDMERTRVRLRTDTMLIALSPESIKENVSVSITALATSRENVSSNVCNQVRFKSACSATEASWKLVNEINAFKIMLYVV